MAKVIKAVVVVAVILGVAIGNYVARERTEENARALARQSLQSDIKMGYAPMSWTCERLNMEFTVNDDGETVCSGSPSIGGKELHEAAAANHLMDSCEVGGVNGAAKMDGMKLSGAPALAVRCTGTRFTQRWAEAQEK